ncbi:hypothetical protein [Aquimarina algicola]|uniref:VCBS repeat-containing protein n=1 Tax=Aquimarina algicola TaxID=2589995 RepID=A0A504JE06_9FLAO|nr:hypothetical protein [Aquimarina algicola]TPN85938.1 hypothetical protein FHK87_11700 [Aquimarina algicola]
MKSYTFNIFLILLHVALYCNAQNKATDTITNTAAINPFQSMIEESKNYLKNRDLDGDKIYDKILFQYSGGGHCCYTMTLYLSSLDRMITYPFEMDGGYLFGVDGSNPEHFYIDDYDDDGLPEIFMEISTYNGEKYPLNKKWIKKYGFKTHYILFDFLEGKIVIKDYKQ